MRTFSSLLVLLWLLAPPPARAAEPPAPAARLIELFKMQKIPDEGCWFVQTYRSDETVKAGGAALTLRHGPLDRHRHLRAGNARGILGAAPAGNRRGVSLVRRQRAGNAAPLSRRPRRNADPRAGRVQGRASADRHSARRLAGVAPGGIRRAGRATRSSGPRFRRASSTAISAWAPGRNC